MEISVIHQPRFKVVVDGDLTIECETIFDVIQAVRSHAVNADGSDTTLGLNFDYRVAVTDRNRIIEGVNEAVVTPSDDSE